MFEVRMKGEILMVYEDSSKNLEKREKDQGFSEKSLKKRAK